jgi:hypothetical protein
LGLKGGNEGDEEEEITNEMQVECVRENCANASSSLSCTSFHAAA